ncbi:MAG: FtsX-like permease family protein [Euryarchaeota archaeon]|nr:FtsX-like permease family protein [Euryarchaeota archaeon]
MIVPVVLTLTIIIGVGLILLGLGDPLTARLGLRNALRHRRQTLTVVIGLMVGTMVVGASLVTGDSLEAGLRDTALSSLDELDVLVRIPGNLPVPSGLMAEVTADPLPDAVEGTSRTFLGGASVEHPVEDLYEPSTAVVGFDPIEDRPFGPFVDATDRSEIYGDELGPREVYVNERLADKLSAEAGDTLTLTYREVFVPLVPELTFLNGTLAAASAAPDPTGGYVYQHAPQDVYETSFEVSRRTEQVVAALFWPDPFNTTDLDLELVAPDGRSFVEDEGSMAAAPAPGLPVTPPLPPPEEAKTDRMNPTFLDIGTEEVVAGEWTLRVHAKAARDQPFTAVVGVMEPEYDLNKAVRFYESLDEDLRDSPFFEDLDPSEALSGGGKQVNVTVKRVVAMEGKAVFFYSDAVFMRLDAAQSLYGIEGKVNWLKITAEGGRLGGLDHARSIESFLNGRLDEIRMSSGAAPSDPESNLAVDAIKVEWLEGTQEAASVFTQFLTLIGSFAIVAGVMLIINIFSMLAEERKHELGISRAVGLTRGKLVTMFTFEGSLYTFFSAALGVLAGMGLSLLLVFGINRLVPPDSYFRVPFTATTEALALAFAIGSLLTFATVLFASWRASRLNVVRAIRGLPEPAVSGREVRWKMPAALAGALLVLALVGILVESQILAVVAPALALFAMGPVLMRWLPRKAAWLMASGAVIAFTLLSFVLFDLAPGIDGDLSIAVRGVVLVIAATVLVVHLDAASRGVARLLSLSRHLAPVARVATMYPLHRRVRTGLTLSMYALVILVIVMFSVFFGIFTPDLTRQTGGYEVMAESEIIEADLVALADTAGLTGTEADPFRDVARFDTLIEHFEFGEERILVDGEAPEGFGGRSAHFYGYERPFAENNGFGLDEWDRSLGSTPNEVFERVLEEPGLVIVSYSIVADPEAKDGKRWHSGATLTINTTAGQSDYRIAGIMEQTLFGGVWMDKAEMERLFADNEGFYLFDLEPGADSEAAAKRIERAFRFIGMDAHSAEVEAREFDQQSERVFQLFQAYLAIGLVVGVASIGIVTSRAVLERRREIGMLKAIGWTRRLVATVFLVEVLVMLFAAMVIGVSLGILVAYLIYVAQVAAIPGVSWGVPWWDILEMLGVALVATIAATIVPLARAGRMSPAEALRTLE